MAAAAGWHGKLPTLGDFATRRLDPDFVQAWDGWLSQGLVALRSRAGWLDAYLASPSWCFLLMPAALPGALGERAWAGVLMPSVDCVGRYYPFTVAQPLAALPGTGDEASALWRWLQRVDEAAAQALQEDWDVPTLEAELARVGVPAPSGAMPPAALPGADAYALPLDDGVDPPAQLCAQAAALWHGRMHARALWYGVPEGARPCLLASPGLDGPALVERLLGGVVPAAAAAHAQPAP